MHPGRKGWLKKYLEQRNKMPEKTEALVMKPVLSVPFNEEFLYRTVQPSGLMYGYPILIPNVIIPGSEKWLEHERLKVLLLESFFSSTVASNKPEFLTPDDKIELFHQTTRELKDYYSEVFPELNISKKAKSPEEVAEIIINQRVEVKLTWQKNFWMNFFHNSLLFLDVFYFDQWLKKENKNGSIDVVEERDEIRMTVLNVISAAAHANESIEEEETSLFNYFLDSAGLPPEKQLKAREIFHKGISIDDINFKKYDLWLLKKYFFELALLTVWADRIYETTEAEFIKKLSKKLNLDDEEVLGSMAAVESFVMMYWEKIRFLNLKHDFSVAKERFANKLTDLMEFYKTGIRTEIYESKELLQLLNKSRTQTLTAEEKEKVRQQLIDIVKTLPMFVVLALPGRFLTLPILLKILPKSALPTGFQDDKQ